MHLFVKHDPEWLVSSVVNRFEGFMSRVLRSEFPYVWSWLPMLWASYFGTTVGVVSADVVRRYIDDQWGRV